MTNDQKLASVMERLELLLPEVPIGHLRAVVMHGESLVNLNKPDLPSGNAFHRHTQRARLWLDFLDEWTELIKAEATNDP